MDGEVRTVDRAIADLASRSLGVVTRGQLLDRGISVGVIDTRVKNGKLIAVHRGVYRVGHAAPITEAAYLAAVLACGSRAVLSGRAAAHLWTLLRARPPRPEVIAPSERNVPGVVTRRCRRLDRRQTTVHRGIPILSVPETLLDLAASLPAPALARACHEAQVRHDLKPQQVEKALARRPNTPGAANLRRILVGDEPVTLSELERRFLSLLRANELPLPRTNPRFGHRRLDCRWPDHRVVVELDSYRHHSSRHAWEEDRRRERLVRAAGDEFRRYTWSDVFEHPVPMLRELRSLLAPNE